MDIYGIIRAGSIVVFAIPSLAYAQENTQSLGDYLKSMDGAPVTFSGRITYDNSRHSTPFTFYDENGDYFFVTMDAGRDTRERIEIECESDNWSWSKRCKIEGKGTVEIRGRNIFLSIEHVSSLKPQK